MKKGLVVVVLLALAAAGATWLRYESFDPCDWMVHDAVSQSGLPPLVVETRLRAELLLQGVTAPDAEQCLVHWWKVRQDGLPTEQG